MLRFDPEIESIAMNSPSGFSCTTCKKQHRFSVYVFGHMNEHLTHTCDQCGAQHDIFQGQAKLTRAGTLPGDLPPDRYRTDDLWHNSRGTPHKVLRVERGIAHFVNLKNSRTACRAADDVGNGWVRVSSGEKAAA